QPARAGHMSVRRGGAGFSGRSKISAEDMGNEEEAMPKIEARYLRRLSAVYERQSTLAQVEGNENSRLYQESQKEVAHRYGWAENRIIAIDEDLGVSGASAGRAGYQRLLRLIREGQVGAVFISDVTRGGRDPVAWFQLLELMAQKDVLLFV